MNKGEQIKEFLLANKPTDKKAALAAFMKKTKQEVSSARFHGVWKEVFGDATGKPLQSTIIMDLPEDEEVRLTKIEKIKYPDSVLIPIKSGTAMDTLVSTDGGTMPATVTIVPGESGVGKTTVLLEYFGQIKKANPKKRLLFISSEMNDLHLFKYSKRIKFEGVEIMLLGDFKNPKLVLAKIFAEGWDIILIDSIQDTINKIVATGAMKPVAAESWLLSEMDKTRKAGNALKLYTAFYCTNHFTKGETYAGSSNLKHMTDAMLMMQMDSLEDTFIEYVKNRDGNKGQKLYFKITNAGVVFNAERFKRDEDTKREINKVKDEVTKKTAEWDDFFPTPEKEEKETVDLPSSPKQGKKKKSHN
jgi:predicted ATP-dependent serine protease